MAVLSLLAACQSEKQPATFYPMDSLILDQVEHLANIRARLFKEAFLDGETDTITYVPDNVGWEKELAIFSKLNEINKPINRNNYEVSDGLLDSGSNLTVKAFRSLRDLPVVYLRIYYQGTLEKPRKIEAMYDEENLLFSSRRLLSMHLQQVDSKTVVTSYSVKGGQKMILGDSVAFTIRGNVLID